MNIKNYVIERDEKRKGLYWLYSKNICGSLVFYYDREETKKHHKINIKHGYSVINKAKGVYKRLIGCDFDIRDKDLVCRIINAYIKDKI